MVVCVIDQFRDVSYSVVSDLVLQAFEKFRDYWYLVNGL